MDCNNCDQRCNTGSLKSDTVASRKKLHGTIILRLLSSNRGMCRTGSIKTADLDPAYPGRKIQEKTPAKRTIAFCSASIKSIFSSSSPFKTGTVKPGIL